MFRSLICIASLAAMVHPCSQPLAAPAMEDVFRVLEEHNVQVDRNLLEESAVETVIGGIDARAKIIPASETQTFLRGKTVSEAQEWHEGVCYLKLNGLYEGGGREVVEQINAWAEAGRIGLIMDLRGAEGGSLSSVDHIAGAFVANDTPLYEIRNSTNGLVETHTAQQTSFSCTMPVLLAIDAQTAGASEVLAMALKGKKGIMLIGQPTAKDCRFREILPLTDEHSVYIATGRIVPAGNAAREYDGVGPDLEISNDVPDTAATKPDNPDRPISDKRLKYRELMERAGNDAVLHRAADILLGLKAINGP